LAAVYLTFLFSFVLLLLATSQFLLGSATDKVACHALRAPNESEVFHLVDERVLQPLLEERKPYEQWQPSSVVDLVERCHANMTLYEVLRAGDVHDLEKLRGWRSHYNISQSIDALKARIRLKDLRNIQILSPEAERELRLLADSQISDLNFSKYTELLERRITAVDLSSFTAKLRRVKERLTRNQARLVGAALENEALFLDQMQRVVMDMKVAIRELDASVNALEREARHAKPNLREAVGALIDQATKATAFIRDEGPQLVDELTEQYVNETTMLIDGYVDRVINRTRGSVGRCRPISTAYNATVIAVCNEIVDPFNGFWTSVGWCLLYFLPGLFLALPLVGLYRKSEPYPGPLVEAIPSEEQQQQQRSSHAKKKRRGHRRNASEYLPDSAHYRAGYSYQQRENRFQDVAPRTYGNESSGGGGTSSMAGSSAIQLQSQVSHASAAGGSGATSAPSTSGGPPRYSSNPNLAAAASASGPPPEYERPPPYYYPGASAPPSGDAPPPLPAPNRP
jgi:prominin 1